MKLISDVVQEHITELAVLKGKVELLEKLITKQHTCRVEFRRNANGKVFMTTSITNLATEEDVIRSETLGVDSMARNTNFDDDNAVEELAKKRTGRENSRFHSLKKKFSTTASL